MGPGGARTRGAEQSITGCRYQCGTTSGEQSERPGRTPEDSAGALAGSPGKLRDSKVQVLELSRQLEDMFERATELGTSWWVYSSIKAQPVDWDLRGCTQEAWGRRALAFRRSREVDVHCRSELRAGDTVTDLTVWRAQGVTSRAVCAHQKPSVCRNWKAQHGLRGSWASRRS